MTGVIGVDSSGLLWYKHQESTPVIYTDYLPNSRVRVINASVTATQVKPSSNTSIELDLRGFYEVGDFIIVNIQTIVNKNLLIVSYSDNQYSGETISVSKYIEKPQQPVWGSFFLKFTSKVPSFVYIQISSSTAASNLLNKDVNVLVDVYKRVV